ncbi:MAG: 50S ribosomal protein L29 [Succinivibrionaceae bacterium]|nr:50S ribosomal protein L29 [Succinivibrionaceae bacterium]
MSVDELKQEISKLQREHFNLRFQLTSGTLKQTDNVRKARRNIARAYTVLTEKLRAEEGAK